MRGRPRRRWGRDVRPRPTRRGRNRTRRRDERGRHGGLDPCQRGRRPERTGRPGTGRVAVPFGRSSVRRLEPGGWSPGRVTARRGRWIRTCVVRRYESRIGSSTLGGTLRGPRLGTSTVWTGRCGRSHGQSTTPSGFESGVVGCGAVRCGAVVGCEPLTVSVTGRIRANQVRGSKNMTVIGRVRRRFLRVRTGRDTPGRPPARRAPSR
jgi:hypothetical protein